MKSVKVGGTILALAVLLTLLSPGTYELNTTIGIAPMTSGVSSSDTYVVTRTDDPSPDGCQLMDCSLREALIASNVLPGHDTIALSEGTYLLSRKGADEDQSQTGDLDIRDDVSIIGPSSGTTLIDGGGGDRVLHVVRQPSRTVGVEVRGATIQNGMATFSSGVASGSGGGLSLEDGADVVLADVMVRANRASLRGGGIYSEAGAVVGGSLRAEDASIIENTAGTPSGGIGGGGLYLRGDVILRRVSITDNAAGFLAGGGIYNADGDLEVESSTIAANTAGTSGGILNGGSLSMVGSRVELNVATAGGGGLGGAGDGIVISNSTISNNSAGQAGGGINFSGDPGVTLSITGSTVSDNIAGASGGGIFSWVSGSVNLTNVTISGNSAQDSGAAHYLQGGSTAILNSTISHNTSGTAAGASLHVESGTLSLRSSIVASDESLVNCSGYITSLGHNIETGAACGLSGEGDLQSTNPMLGPLLNNGGETLSHVPGGGSAAIDRGDMATCPLTDQRGFGRPVDGDGDGSEECDIGSIEVGTKPTSTPTLTSAASPTPTTTATATLKRRGDVNCNQSVDSIDAALILQYVASIVHSLPCLESGDVTKDHRIDAIDALLILQFVAGLIDDLK